MVSLSKHLFGIVSKTTTRRGVSCGRPWGMGGAAVHQPRPDFRLTGETRYPRCGAILRRRYRVSPVRRKKAGTHATIVIGRGHPVPTPPSSYRGHPVPTPPSSCRGHPVPTVGRGTGAATPCYGPLHAWAYPTPLLHGRPHPDAPTWSQPGLGRGLLRLQLGATYTRIRHHLTVNAGSSPADRRVACPHPGPHPNPVVPGKPGTYGGAPDGRGERGDGRMPRVVFGLSKRTL